QLNHTMDQQWGRHLLRKKNNAQILIDRWMNHREYSKLYNLLVDYTFHSHEVQKQLEKIAPEDCLEADTFSFFDKIIIKGIVDKLLTDQEDYEDWLSWINERKTKHWYRDFEDV